MIAYKDVQICRDLRSRIEAVFSDSGFLKENPPLDLESDRDRLSTRLMDVFRITGNPEAYDLLFDLNQNRLRKTIGNRLRYLSLSVDASDILQEAFLNIYRYPYRFRSDKDSAFRVWTSTIVANVIRRHLRRCMERPHLFAALPESASTEVPDPGAEPLRFAMEEESRESFSRLYLLFLSCYLESYRQLPSRDRLVLRLVEVEEKRYREVGNLLKTRADNVKMLVFRARQRLFRGMEEIFARAQEPSESTV